MVRLQFLLDVKHLSIHIYIYINFINSLSYLTVPSTSSGSISKPNTLFACERSWKSCVLSSEESFGVPGLSTVDSGLICICAVFVGAVMA